VIYVEQCLGGKLGEDLKPTEMMGDVRERERERDGARPGGGQK